MITKLNELVEGQQVHSHSRGGDGIVTNKTPRTVTIKLPFSTTKLTFKKDCTLHEVGIHLI